MDFRRCRFAALISFSLCLMAAGVCQAAIDRGAIQGTITDPQGAIVPNVAVEITNTATNVTVNTRTNDAGFYAVT